MVGQTILKQGDLEVKPPATSFARGWRIKPWKLRHVKLVDDNGMIEFHIYDGSDLKDVYELEKVTDVTMVTSKTHVHAFEIVAGGKSVIILSGSSEIESRDWIWTLRKIFWPQALAEVEREEKLRVQMAPSVDSRRLGLQSGIYELDVTVTSLSLSYVGKCPSQDRLTPVEPFTDVEAVKNLSIPLTTVGRYKLEQTAGTHSITIETTPEYHRGKVSLSLLETPDAGDDQTLDDVMETIKAKVFRATNNLHDCIASTKWRLADHA